MFLIDRILSFEIIICLEFFERYNFVICSNRLIRWFGLFDFLRGCIWILLLLKLIIIWWFFLDIFILFILLLKDICLDKVFEFMFLIFSWWSAIVNFLVINIKFFREVFGGDLWFFSLILVYEMYGFLGLVLVLFFYFLNDVFK